MLKAVHQTKLKKCEGQRRSLWQWRTAQPEVGALFLTCKPSFGRCDLSTIPSAHWPKGSAVALFKSEEWENAKAQSPFFINPLWGFQSCNQVIAWLTIWTDPIKWFFDCFLPPQLDSLELTPKYLQFFVTIPSVLKSRSCLFQKLTCGETKPSPITSCS